MALFELDQEFGTEPGGGMERPNLQGLRGGGH